MMQIFMVTFTNHRNQFRNGVDPPQRPPFKPVKDMATKKENVEATDNEIRRFFANVDQVHFCKTKCHITNQSQFPINSFHSYMAGPILLNKPGKSHLNDPG